METPKPMQGIWTLIAPDGRTWQAESPLRVVAKESRERVPASVALERIYAAADETPDPLYDAMKKIVRTPAMPFPDPGAHSMFAFYQAVQHAYMDIQRIAREALAEVQKPNEQKASTIQRTGLVRVISSDAPANEAAPGIATRDWPMPVSNAPSHRCLLCGTSYYAPGICDHCEENVTLTELVKL